MARSLRLTAAVLSLGAVSLALGACEPMYGPPPPTRITTPTEDTQFRAGAELIAHHPLGVARH